MKAACNIAKGQITNHMLFGGMGTYPFGLSREHTSRSATCQHCHFGRLVATRAYSSGAYRYACLPVTCLPIGKRQGFNGKEKDEETFEGAYDFGARIYDGRLGRWLAVDPLFYMFYEHSLFSGMANNPLMYIDPTGETIIISTTVKVKGENNVEKEEERKYTYKKGKLYDESGNEFTPEEGSYEQKVRDQLREISKTKGILSKRLKILEKSKNIHTIKNTPSDDKFDNHCTGSIDNTKNFENGQGTTTYYDPNIGMTKNGDIRPSVVTLVHELIGHGFDFDQGQMTFELCEINVTHNGKTKIAPIKYSEINAIYIENLMRSAIGSSQRTMYAGVEIPKDTLSKEVKLKLSKSEKKKLRKIDDVKKEFNEKKSKNPDGYWFSYN